MFEPFLLIRRAAMFDVHQKTTGTKTLTRAAMGLLCGVLGTSMLAAADFSSYRGFQFGMNLSAAAKQAGTKLSEVRLVHQRPAVIQEMDWWPRSFVLADRTTT